MDDEQKGIRGEKTDEKAVEVLSPQTDATIYRMDKETRGVALIINNHHFQKSSGMKDRNGTDKDRDALIDVFKMLKFKVKPYDDQTTSEMKKQLKKLADKKHAKYDAIVVAILSHGDADNIIYSADGEMDLESITRPFHGPNLAGKPKIFIFQACRGQQFMDGVDVTDSPWKPTKPPSRVQIPVEPDCLYAYSTTPGYFSWRNSTNGSWFIQSLARVFAQHAHEMDIIRMLTRVNYAVATFKSHTYKEESNEKMQVSTIVSTLRKDLFFFPENILNKQGKPGY